MSSEEGEQARIQIDYYARFHTSDLTELSVVVSPHNPSGPIMDIMSSPY